MTCITVTMLCKAENSANITANIKQYNTWSKHATSLLLTTEDTSV